MDDTMLLKVAQRGAITLPKALRDRYQIQPGDTLTLRDAGGVFVIRLRRSEIDGIADRLKEELIKQGESLESVLETLREIRDLSTNDEG